MRVPWPWLGVHALVALLADSASVRAQPVGLEFQANTYTSGAQMAPAVTSGGNGEFVVVWQSFEQDGQSFGIFGQRFDVGGAAGDEFGANSYTQHGQRFPSVASDAAGNFVVVWESDVQDGSSTGIFAQRYDGSGAALGAEFRVNSSTTSVQNFASVASDAGGNFVVVWQGQDGYQQGIFGQRYDSGGAPQGGEFRVNSHTTSIQSFPAVASDANGSFVVVWNSAFQEDGLSYCIFGQRYDAGGVPLGGEFRVNTYTKDSQASPAVASDAHGNLVVVWSSELQDGSGSGVFGQRYDNAGAPQGGEFRVNSVTAGQQLAPSVGADAHGNFLVAWSSDQDGSGFGIFGQRYDGSGIPQGGEFQVNEFTTNNQSTSRVAATNENAFVVTWSSYKQDGSRFGIFGRSLDPGDLPSLSIADATVVEGNLPGMATRPPASFAVRLSAP